MSSGDLLSVAAGVVIVVLVASAVQWWGDDRLPIDNSTENVQPLLLHQTDPTQSPTPVPLPTISKIGYVEKPVLKYKTYLLPDNISLFGASDPSWKTKDSVAFASLEEEHGGVTGTFTVPYPMWRMNCTVTPDDSPEYTLFRAILIDVKTNAIIEGIELRAPGHVIKNIMVSDGEYYLVVECRHAHFTIDMETKKEFIR
ncbi:hypothetical protein RJ40_01585 [Methanofollis aquaemaris]|uniref:Uncharacterized protein n=1 Tax=Methanofollis aquaemaris TaxID=126734 RepID=A0A8A3S3G4_9EURY|nr:hypothetical protein [Methanofollis aquaemaris]QSZ66281.1 hypothetical protein RJ40_01585 [Methanofollis aquaemaris]